MGCESASGALSRSIYRSVATRLITLCDQQGVKSFPSTVGGTRGEKWEGGVCFASDARTVGASFMKARFLEHPRSFLSPRRVGHRRYFHSYIRRVLRTPEIPYARESSAGRLVLRGAQVVDRRSSSIYRAALSSSVTLGRGARYRSGAFDK